MSRILKSLRRRVFTGYQSTRPFDLLERNFEATKKSLTFFYGVLLLMSFNYLQVFSSTKNTEDLNPPMLFDFLVYLPREIIGLLFLGGVPLALATFLWPRFQILRISVFLLLLTLFAYKCSFNAYHRNELLVYYMAFAFALIPTWGKARVSIFTRYLHVNLFWFGLLLFLLPYTLSGLWKVFWGMGWQFINENVSFWSSNSMSYIVSSWSIRSGNHGVLSDFFIYNELPGFLLLVFGTFWEVFAVLPLFRPSHWKLAVGLLLVFHSFSLYILDINFMWPLIAIVFFLSRVPLQKEAVTAVDVVGDIPIIGRWLVTRFFRKPEGA